MAEQHQEKRGLMQSPALVIVAVVASIVIPVAGYFIAQLATGGRPARDSSEEAVARRILPVARVELASAAAGAPGVKTSEEIYKSICAACHDSGVADAPKVGDKAAWASRIAVGLDKLAQSGIKGKGAMPPKGGADLADADFTRVVAYLANKSGASFKEPAAPAPAPAATSAPAPAAAATPAPAPTAAAPAAAPAPAPAAPAAAPTAAPAGSAGAGKKVYDATCVVCHGAGVAGAPKLGDKAAWAPRLKTGMDALVNSALKGKGAMPPKGGNASIPDADIKAAVEYMAASAK